MYPFRVEASKVDISSTQSFSNTATVKSTLGILTTVFAGLIFVVTLNILQVLECSGFTAVIANPKRITIILGLDSCNHVVGIELESGCFQMFSVLVTQRHSHLFL